MVSPCLFKLVRKSDCLTASCRLATNRTGLAVAQPIIWKEMTTAYNGRAIAGSWAVDNGVVKVRTTFGGKAAPLDGADGVWIAWRLLREMAAEGKA
jgi:hypothetical protein